MAFLTIEAINDYLDGKRYAITNFNFPVSSPDLQLGFDLVSRRSNPDVHTFRRPGCLVN